MRKVFLKLALISLSSFGLASQATADVITINFTADNIVDLSGLCDDPSCTGGEEWANLGAVPNRDDWTTSDSVTLDLGPGTYYFVWYVENVGSGGSGNPAGLLAEIIYGGDANYSSSGWDVSTTFGGPWSTSATSYGYNGGSNIWSSALGGPVSGISTDAQWLWTDNNGNSDMDQYAGFRTSITITAVPEPGTLALLGIGLLGIGYSTRRGKV